MDYLDVCSAVMSMVGLLQVERKQRELRSTLLKCIRYIDVLESRFANASGYFANETGKQRLDDISRELAALEVEISPVVQKGMSPCATLVYLFNSFITRVSPLDPAFLTGLSTA